jgi:hypothetical protein
MDEYAKWNKMDATGLNMVWFHLREVPRIAKVIVTESRVVVTGGWVDGGMGSQCVMGTGFQFGWWTISGDGWG